MTYRKASYSDFEILLDIRIRAMKPSLEKINRFDPKRARDRFKKSFLPDRTIIVEEKSRKCTKIKGFYMLSEKEDMIVLHHLYVDPDSQSKGVGSKCLYRIKDLAITAQKRIQLEALKQSRSNDFYQSHGFEKIEESDFDNIYSWSPV